MALQIKPFSLVCTTFLIVFLVGKTNSAKVVSFNFTKFTNGSSSITLQGDAQISANGILALTSHETPPLNIGRALYSTPINIWDNTTGNVASFVTSFTFLVGDLKGYIPADGIIFFLAPTDTEIPFGAIGGDLGVVKSISAYNKFVGVEFDDYVNENDPNYAHVGIDVNSLISLKTVKWNKVSGSLVKVTIIYDSLSRTLSVAVTNNDGRITTIAQVVDLKAMLPSKVKVGFSASTSFGGAQKHDIYSWSFTSNLDTTTSNTKEDRNLASYV